jgi:hypothetical protein
MGYGQGSGLKNELDQGGLGGPLSGTLFTYMFGPQIKKHSGKLQPFAEALFGGARLNMSGSILADEGRLPHGNGFAMALGGGIDLRFTKHVELRPAEVDYLLTHFGANVPNYGGSQNSFRYVAGVNFLFGVP